MGTKGPTADRPLRRKFPRVALEPLRDGPRRNKKLTLTDAIAKAIEVNAARRGLTESEVVMRSIEQTIPEAKPDRPKRTRPAKAEPAAGGGDEPEAEAA